MSTVVLDFRSDPAIIVGQRVYLDALLASFRETLGSDFIVDGGTVGVTTNGLEGREIRATNQSNRAVVRAYKVGTSIYLRAAAYQINDKSMTEAAERYLDSFRVNAK